MNSEFISKRVTQLRLKKGVSEYQMSYDLGHSRGYIVNIASGKSLPSLSELCEICDYFGITLLQFFDESDSDPEIIQKAVEGMRKLNPDDQQKILDQISALLQS